MSDSFDGKYKDENNLLKDILRYVSFWPWYLGSILFFVIAAHLHLRYSDYLYQTSAKIEIIDKAQDSEMALPTAMTIFNRSLINLDNEIGVIKSFSLHKKVCEILNWNVKYFSVGNIKMSENHPSEWNNVEIDFLIDTDKILSNPTFEIKGSQKDFLVFHYENDKLISKYNFSNTSKNSSHELPFEVSILKPTQELHKKIKILSINSVAQKMSKDIKIESDNKPYGGSDQLLLSHLGTNKKLSQTYLNKLISEFDSDGIADRQLEYLRTIEFVESRSVILKSELEQIEEKKLDFKKNNNLTNLETDVSIMTSSQINYNNELFQAETQKDLAILLKNSITKSDYTYLPVNIGVEDNIINSIVSDYNNLIKERDMFLISAGPKNSVVQSVESQLDNLIENIVTSIENYINKIELNIKNILSKENELSEFSKNLPFNEKTLRAIERELNIKEALFLLLLQKKEEASINYAVVKPSIKIIDLSISEKNHVSPNIIFTYLLAVSLGLSLPIAILYIYFFFDNKIHNRNDLEKLLSKSSKIIGELPYVGNNKELLKISKSDSRSNFSESLRVVITNLKFSLAFQQKKDKGVVTLVTSSIKGEGKTIISVNIASLLSSTNKVLLIGSDLRNPQIHKFLSKTKNELGLSDIIYKQNFNNYEDYIHKINNLDILLSGTIPPNPTELLSSSVFKKFIDKLRDKYDYIIIDSAPCLLVSDTFEISKISDFTIYVFRASHTPKNIVDFMNDSIENNKFNNVSIVVNSLGNSRAYGYSYRYGYRYGYKYGYNYGYGYGYNEKS